MSEELPLVKKRKKAGRKASTIAERERKHKEALLRYSNSPARKEYVRRYSKWRYQLQKLGVIPLWGGKFEADPEQLKNIVPFSQWKEGRPPVYELPPTRNEADKPYHDYRLDYKPWSRKGDSEPPKLADLANTSPVYTPPAPKQHFTLPKSTPSRIKTGIVEKPPKPL